MKLTRRSAVKAITASIGAATLAGSESFGTAAAAGAPSPLPAEVGEAVDVQGETTAPQGDQVLWYDRPAKEWLEALPVGNGRSGAMVFGGVTRERVQLNEGTLWAGGPHDYTSPEALAALPEIRKRVFTQDWLGAQELTNAHFMSRPLRQAPYQTLGSLLLNQHARSAKPTEYRRELNLDTAVATTSYALEGVRYQREVFASAPDQLIFVNLTADRPGQISFTATLETPHKASAGPGAGKAALTSVTDSRLSAIKIEGRGGELDGIPGAIQFAAVARAFAEGGTVGFGQDGTLKVEGATSATLLIATATSHNTYRDVSADPIARAQRRLDAVASKPYKRLREAHVADYQRLYRRVGIDLATAYGPASRGVRQGEGSRAGRAALPIRAVLAHLQLAGRRPARDSPGPVERQYLAAVGLEVHCEHQHGDELLARRHRQSSRVLRAAVCHAQGSGVRRPENGKAAL